MLCWCWSAMLTWHSIRNIVRKVFYIFYEWWWARSAINIGIILFLNDKSNVVLVLSCNADLAQHLNHCKKNVLYIWRMMMGALIHQHSYNTVLNDKLNVVLVLTCNVDLAQHSNHCKKSFLYNFRMMNGELSYQHSYHCSYKNLNDDCWLMTIALTSHTYSNRCHDIGTNHNRVNLTFRWNQDMTLSYLWQIHIDLLIIFVSKFHKNQ